MKIVRITPGLGNQMFQYSFILNYKLRGEKIFLDIEPCKNSKKHNSFELYKIFNVKEKKATFLQKFKLIGISFYINTREITFLKLLNKIISKVFREKFILNFKKYIIEKESSLEFNFNKKYLSIGIDAYFAGYFCSQKYFENIKDEVKNIFTFPEIKKEDKENFNVLEKIKKSESLSIHVRRGDYVGTDLDICDKNYFEKSFKYIENILLSKRNILKEDIKIFIFSDDLNWCKENFNFLSVYEVLFIDFNKKENSFKDMQLMSECKHNIISNSTFSWWSAYLNKNTSKIIVVPKYWFKNVKTTEDRVFDRCIII